MEATLVVFKSLDSATAIANRLILLQGMCMCEQNPLYSLMKKPYHSLAIMFLQHKRLLTHKCTKIHSVCTHIETCVQGKSS